MFKPIGFTFGLAVLASACTAASVSPPLTARGSPDPRRSFGGVQVTSGAFQRPHHVIGVMQMTQTGYKWLHEIEIIDDARPDSLLFKVGHYAHELGADGIQHFEIIDLDPQTPADTAGKKIDSTVRIAQDIDKKQYAAIAGEGTKTRYEVRGELIQFLDSQGAL
ncbi:MAG TPA: hypothetical protein VIV40_24765 [Kofleriaceae bacterium]